jgi:hypothetical protein
MNRLIDAQMRQGRIMRGSIGALALTTLLVLSGCVTPTVPMSESEGEEDLEEGDACNGLVVLCERSYSDVTFPETHNAFSTHEDGIYYPAANHQTGLLAQWNAGMRAFMIDTHYETLGDERVETVRLCHGDDDRGFSPCSYGNVNAESWLSQLKGLMENSPRDVVTLLVENYVQPDHLKTVFEASGLYDQVFIHSMNEPWPTLEAMIQSGTPLVVFWEQSADPNHPWIHDFLTHSWTTNFAEENTEDMNCDPLRGDPEQEVFHMNNWLSGPLGLSDPSRGDEANNVDFLIERATECWVQHGKRPTFIAVDWWEDGDVVAAALAINQMEPPV